MTAWGGKALRLGTAVCTLLMGAPDAGNAQDEPHAAFPEIRRLDVPADDASGWPPGEWRPIAWSDLQRLLAVARAEPEQRRAWIDKAVYSATLSGDALRGGTLTARVRRRGRRAALLPLSPLNLAVSGLRWSDGEAVWGSAADGRALLLVDRETGDLEAGWSSRGRRFPQSLEFDLELPPATVSVLQLRLPPDRRLESSAGQVIRPEHRDGWALWRVQMGSETNCRLSILPVRDAMDGEPRLLADSELSWVLREDALRVQAGFNVEVAGAAVDELLFALPAELHVFAVTYGPETPLSFETTVTGPEQLMRVRLPDSLLGRGRTIRVAGFTDFPGQGEIPLPQITMPQATHLSGRCALTVAAPLELRRIRANGFRQTSPVTGGEDGETVTFDRLMPQGRIVVNAARPESSLSARVFSILDADEESWTLTSDIRWTADSGSTFTTRCRMPAGWDVTDVQILSDGDSADRVTWEQDGPSADGGTLLSVDFLEAVAPAAEKRVRIRARRRSAAFNRPIALPVLRPLGCDDAELMLALPATGATTPVLEADSTFESISGQDVAEDWTAQPLWDVVSTAGFNEFLFARGDLADVPGNLRLQSELRSVDAIANVAVSPGSGEVAEEFTIRCHPVAEPVERLQIYLTTPGPEIRWRLRGAGVDGFSSTRLPLPQILETDLPEGGELWEFRLSSPTDAEFVIEGRRSRATSGRRGAGLVFVPQSQNFKGIVTLHPPSEAPLAVTTSGLYPLDPESEGAAGSVRRWSYDTADDDLRFDWPPQSPEPAAPAAAFLLLESAIAAHSRDDDLYRARFLVTSGSSESPFRFTLPGSATLITVAVNGTPAIPTATGDGFLVPGLRSNQTNTVELTFRVSGFGRRLRDLRQIVVPRTDRPILGFRWRFALPRGARLAAVPRSVRLTTPLKVPGWTERLFGPLGRPRGQNVFNPFSADDWSAFVKTQDSDSRAEGSDPLLPEGWPVFEAVAPSSPETLTIETWQRSDLRALQLAAMFLSLMAGCLVRMRRVPGRARIAAYWSALCLSTVWFVPPVVAELIGSCYVGTMIAMLLPRRVLLPEPARNAPLENTRSFEKLSALAPLVVIAAPAFSVWGQDPAPPARSDFNLLVPVGTDGEPEGDPLVVYVDRDLLAQLRDQANRRDRDPDYLIANGRYAADVNPQGLVTLTARYRVVLLAPQADVLLPLAAGNPAGCRVNGRPHPLLPAADAGSVLLRLVDREARRRGTSEQFRPQMPLSIVDVELELHPPKLTSETGGRVDIRIPALAASQLTLESEQALSMFSVSSARGEVVMQPRGAFAELGNTSRLTASWSREAQPAAKDPSVAARQSVLVEVFPTWLRLQLQVVYASERGELEFAEWRLPDGALVRSVDSLEMLRFTVLDDTDGSRLLIEFTEPRAEAVVQAELLLPAVRRGQRVVVPAIDLFAADPVEVTANEIGVVTDAGYRLESPTSTTEDAVLTTPESFLQGWQDEAPARPAVAYRLTTPVPLEFKLTTLAATRTGRVNQIGRIGKRQLDWTYTAEVETSTAPSYQHRLLVDRRLRIDSFSVLDGGAERLVRRSELPAGPEHRLLVLYLSGPTAGMQYVILKGRMSLRKATKTALPDIRIENAEILDNKLALYHDRDLAVELADAQPMEPGGDRPFDAEGQRFLGRFQLGPEQPLPTIRTVSRSGRCRVESATLLSREPGGGWRQITRLRLRPIDGPGQRFSIQLPVELAADFTLQARGARWRKDPLPDGSLQIVLTPDSPDVGHVVVDVENLVTIPQGGGKLPTATAANAVATDAFLFVQPEDVLQPVRGRDRVDLRSAPAWIDDLTGSSPRRLFHNDTGVWRLEESRRGSSDSFAVSLMQTDVWLEAAGRQSGTTMLFLSPGDRGEIALALPDRTEVVAWFLDGRPLSPPASQAKRISVQRDPSVVPGLLTLYWRRDPAEEPGFVGELAVSTPDMDSLPVSQRLLTVIPAQNWRLIPTRTTPVGWLPVALDRLETLHRGVLHAADDEPNTDWLDLYRRDIERVRSRLDEDGLSAAPALRQRFAVVARDAPRMDAPARSPLPASPPTSLLDHPDALHFRLRSDEAVTFWLLRVGRALGLLALPALLLLIPLLGRIVRLNLGEWLSRHATVAWTLLGVFWWLALTPSFVGLLILTVAAVRGVLQRMQPAEAALSNAQAS